MSLKVGIQLYSVRNEMAEDPRETIRMVAREGYRYIELANHHADIDAGCGFGLSKEEFISLIKEAGVKVIGSHVAPITDENIDAVIDFNRAVGAMAIICPTGFYANTEQEVLAECGKMNRYGKKCAQAGLIYLYHNHFQEFQTIDGKAIMDIILENTDPEFVGIELDTFWAMRGGEDPITLIKKYGCRVKLIHQKDFSKTPEGKTDILAASSKECTGKGREQFEGLTSPKDFTEIGTGTMNIQGIIDAANEIGASQYLILEQDHTALSEVESIRLSYQNLIRYTGIEK